MERAQFTGIIALVLSLAEKIAASTETTVDDLCVRFVRYFTEQPEFEAWLDRRLNPDRADALAIRGMGLMPYGADAGMLAVFDRFRRENHEATEELTAGEFFGTALPLILQLVALIREFRKSKPAPAPEPAAA